MVELDVEFAAKLATKEDVKKVRHRPQRPLHIRRVQSVVSAGGTTTIELGSPVVGREWNITQIVVVGTDDHTVLAGTSVATYLGDPSSPAVGQIIDPSSSSTVPNVATFSERVIWCHSMETLYLLVYGAASGQVLTAIAFINDWQLDSVEPGMI